MAIPLRLPPALRYRDFRLFTLGYFPAETGEYIHFVVQNWLAWELTQSAFYLGLLGFFEFAPRFIFGPIGGVVADRMDRLKLLILSRVANLIQSLIFAFLVFSGLLEFWHIVVLVIFMAIVSSFSTAAQQVVDRHSGAARRSRQRIGAPFGNPQLDQSDRPVDRRRASDFDRSGTLFVHPGAHRLLYAGRALQDAAARFVGDRG